jgi:hypothetical protein
MALVGGRWRTKTPHVIGRLRLRHVMAANRVARHLQRVYSVVLELDRMHIPLARTRRTPMVYK